MWFKVVSKTLENETKEHYFHNVRNLIKDSSLNLIDLSLDPRFEGFKSTPIKHRQRVYKKPNVEVLRIQLGLNCNFSCKYCHQRTCHEINTKTSIVRLPLETNIRNFIKMLKDNDIQVSKRINLWGGEPLVYWKHIKLLVPALKELYPGVDICMISNGSLITEEVVDFLIKHRIILTISHDAQGFSAYRDDADPLENPKIIKALQRYIDESSKATDYWSTLTEEEKSLPENQAKRPFGFTINVVITPANLELDKMDAYFFLKLKRRVNFHYESIVKAGVQTKELMGSFSEEQKTLITNQIFKLAHTNSVNSEENPYYSLRERVSHIFNTLVNKKDANHQQIVCDVASDRNLAVDLQGNILACHGAEAEDWTIGHLSSVSTAINNKVKGWAERPHCPECPFVIHCGGGCVMSSDEDSLSMCEYLKIYHGALFAAAWFDIFGSVIQRIEPCPEMED